MGTIKELLYVSEADIKKVRKSYDKTEEDIKEDVKLLLNWLAKQPQLPISHDEGRVERFLLRNKFRIEQSKTKQDNYYTYRGLYPDFFLNVNSESVAVQAIKKSVAFVPMPKLLPSLDRLTLCVFQEGQEENFNFINLMGFVFIVMDLQLSHDYAIAERYVCDCKHLTLKHVFKIDPTTLHKAVFLHQHAFSGRISNVEFVNLPPAFDVLLSLMKRVFDAKLFGKVRTHRDVKSLYEVLPKEYLPTEYGGNQGSMYEFAERWSKELITQKDFLQENAKRVSKEKLRIGKPIHNELFGVEGTFRKINLD